MRKWSGVVVGLVAGTIGGSFLVGPWLLGQPGGPGPAVPKELTSYRDIVKKVLPAVVSLDTEARPPNKAGPVKAGGSFGKTPILDEFPPGTKPPKQGFGSGFVVDTDGVIITTYHVVAGYNTVIVQFLDGSQYVTSDIHTDKKTDLAIVRIDPKGKKLPVLELGDSDQMEIGDHVLAVGAPFGLRGSVTAGIISGKGRTGLNMNVYEDFLQTDAAINPGNSGGPLVNLEGKAVGINAAIKSKSGGFDGVGLAVASNLARGVKDALVKFGKVSRGYLGAQVVDLDPSMAEKLGLPKNTGAIVSLVFPNSPAAKVGLQPGDVITKIGGKVVTDGKQMQSLILDLPPNQPASVEILRDGKAQTLAAVIDEQPDVFGQPVPPAPSPPAPATGAVVQLDQLGINVADLTPALAIKLGYEPDVRGAAISKVDPGSPAQAAGLKGGMLILKVDNQPVAGAEAARSLIGKASLTKGISLQVRLPQGGGTKTVLIKAK